MNHLFYCFFIFILFYNNTNILYFTLLLQIQLQQIKLMPPKKDEKKQIVRAFEPKSFWKYTQPTPQLIQKANTFLATFQKELKELISSQKSVLQNYQILCDKIGIAVHPCLQNRVKQQSKFPNLKNNDYGDHYIQIMNHKIDSITLKLLGFLFSVFKVNSLKFCRNQFIKQIEDVKKILEKDDSITTIFFQWNPLIELQNRRQVFLLTVRPTIQHLILRDNDIGDQIFNQLVMRIKSMPQLCLKSFDVAGNMLTKQSADTICKFIQEQKNLEYFSLAKNNIHGKKFMTKLFNSIGEILIKQQQWQAYQQAVKARDQVIQRNKKKKKGAADEPVPFVLEVKQTEEGRFYVKNTSLQVLSLAKNGIGDTCANLIKNFYQNQGAHIKLFLDGNKFTKKQKQHLKTIENLSL